jgi:hemoglobin
MQDIADAIGQERIAAVVDHFYERIQRHPTLAAPFAGVHDWPAHKAILTHFWWVSLGGKRYLQYPYAVARKHIEAGFTAALLTDWLALFAEVIEADLPPELAQGWLERARKIGESLTYMVEFQQKQGGDPAGRLSQPA